MTFVLTPAPALVVPPALPATEPVAAAPAVSWQGLRRIDMLAHLSEARLAELASRCQWRTLAPQQELEQAFADKRLHLLVQGQLTVHHFSPQGRELMLGEIQAGQSVGDCPSIQGDEPSLSLSVVAAEPCLVATLAPEDALVLFEQEPAVLRATVVRLSFLVRGLAQRLISLGTMPMRTRLHRRLLHLAERVTVVDNQALLSPAPRQAALASFLGCSREEVGREMSRLVRLGLLQRQRTGLLLCNIDGLQALSDEPG